MSSDIDQKNPSKWKKINSRIFKMYHDFNRIPPGSLREIEFKSSRKPEKATYNFNRTSVKTSKLDSFSKDHISLSPGIKIVELPKSPFGRHTNYNQETNFKSNHFLNTTSIVNKSLEKKIMLLKKKINNSFKVKKVLKGYFRADQFMNRYRTNGGNLYSDVHKISYQISDNKKNEFDEINTIRSLSSSTVKDLKQFGLLSPIR